MSKLAVALLYAITITGCAARSTSTAADSRFAVSRYADGASLDQIASELSVDRDAARALVHDALVDLNRRYYGCR